MGKAEPQVSVNLDFSLNGAGKTRSHLKKMRLDTILCSHVSKYSMQKIKLYKHWKKTLVNSFITSKLRRSFMAYD